MTEKEKLEAIRAEIERFRKTNKVSEDKEYAQYELDVKCGYDMALDDMLSYINSLSEETVSEDLEKISYYFACMCHPLITAYSTSSPNPEIIEAFKAGAKWQKQQDQETIELAEDHAMLAGMEKMKEEMMAKAVDGYVIEDIEEGNGDFLLSAEYLPKSMGLKDRQKVKVIAIKEED